MRFAKYHGLGNDFLVVDLRDARAEDADAVQEPAVVRALCDRQFGVGGDGVLAILPSQHADARMRVLNADGSEAEMCGNGIRCVAKELHDRGGIAKEEIAIETGAGRLVCELRDGGVTVSMGAPRLTRGEIPMVGPASERCIEQTIPGVGPFTCVSMGNPHAVMFVNSSDDLRRLAETIGPTIERHAWFPQRTNVELAHVRSPQRIDLVVWERGCGITLACGTGACATVVAAALTGRCELGPEVVVRLLGGELSIRVLPEFANVRMHGPAAHVFDGELDPRAVAPRPEP
ncbi:MAG TPA: diaminopimelate epimerase [Kofleriaceae bacterium]|nr:diaminopimelate epimerase [Kofleriaceae bacterium]